MAGARESWQVILHDEVETWFLELVQTDAETTELVERAIDALEADGPTLGRPLVDLVKGAALHNLKELRPGSAGRSEIRVLFVFDDQRRALLLAAGDKAGQWNRWYRSAVPLAVRRYDELVQALRQEGRR